MIPIFEEDFLMISGIQHFAFCKRQWALIHIEQQWAENVKTVEGQVLHKTVDDPYKNESRGDIFSVRAMPLVCKSLGLVGVADLVEFKRMDSFLKDESIKLKRKSGFWKPILIEYKNGRKKSTDCDEVQICAQVIALEEMFEIQINQAQIYYGQTQRRQDINISLELRKRVEVMVNEMHDLMITGSMPSAVWMKSCDNCSLINICNPRLYKKSTKVSSYYKDMIKSYLEELG